jgi:predicted secreted protein
MSGRCSSWGALVLASLVACPGEPRDSGPPVSPCAPVAAAGPDQQVTLGEQVHLDASASEACEPQGEPTASYSWSFDSVPEGSQLEVSAFTVNDSPEAQSSQFSPDVPGTWVLALKVTQGEDSSAPDITVIEVVAGGTAPVADCGGDLEVEVGALTTLDGSGSYDTDGDAISYAWSLTSAPDGSGASLYAADGVQASLVPDLPGTYDVHLVVSDGLLESEPGYCMVAAHGTNQAPVADAGEGGALPPCDDHVIQLEGYGSYDPEGEPLDYLWSLLAIPAGSAASDTPCDTGGPCYMAFDDATTVAPLFTWDLAGEYTFQLTVRDSVQWSAPDVVTYTVSECP